MKLGEVIAKERCGRGMSTVEPREDHQMVADINERLPKALRLPLVDYRSLESGESEAEIWGAALAQIVVFLETPAPRLLTASGTAVDHELGQVGSLITSWRDRRERTREEAATAVTSALGALGTSFSVEDYERIESASSPLETWGPTLLAFAEVVKLPLFSLFYPCGLPFQQLDDYP